MLIENFKEKMILSLRILIPVFNLLLEEYFLLI